MTDSESPWACGPPIAVEIVIVVTVAISPRSEEHQQFENAGAGVERHARAAMNDVVAVERADGDGD